MLKKGKASKFGAGSATDTYIGPNSEFEGTLASKGSIRIEGRISGSVHSQGDVTVGESGVVKADIKARNIIISGSVIGNIHAAEKLTIKPNGRLSGDIVTALLEINEGARYEGTTRMTSESGAGRGSAGAEKDGHPDAAKQAGGQQSAGAQQPSGSKQPANAQEQAQRQRTG